MNLSIPAVDGEGWTANLNTIPAGTTRFSFSATNSIAASMVALSSSGGTLATASGIFGSTNLIPGAGWSGPTPTPSPVGSGFGVDVTAFGQWDCSPMQTFPSLLHPSSTFRVGLVPTHINGTPLDSFSSINYVLMAVNGGPWLTISAASPNPETINSGSVGLTTDAAGKGAYVAGAGLVDYWATLDATAFSADGTAEVRAIIYPKVGIPYVMPTLTLRVNPQGGYTRPAVWIATTGSDTTGDGSESTPYKTQYRAAEYYRANYGNPNDGVVYCKAGTYAYGGLTDEPYASTNGAWFITTIAPGLSPSDVQFTSNSDSEGMSYCNVRMKDVTVNGTGLNQPSDRGQAIWFDGCILKSSGEDSDIAFAGDNWNGGIRFTNCEISKVLNATVNSKLILNTYIHDLGEDALRYTTAAFNILIENLGVVIVPDKHPDAWQDSNGEAVLYGVQAVTNIIGQGISQNADQTNVALLSSNITSVGFVCAQMERHLTNYTIRNTTLLRTGGSPAGLWRTDEPPPKTFSATNVMADGCGVAFDTSVVSGVYYAVP